MATHRTTTQRVTTTERASLMILHVKAWPCNLLEMRQSMFLAATCAYEVVWDSLAGLDSASKSTHSLRSAALDDVGFAMRVPGRTRTALKGVTEP